MVAKWKIMVLALVISVPASARTLTLMPPHRYDNCKPKCKVIIKHHYGQIPCGLGMADACTDMASCTTDMRIDEPGYVHRDTWIHERAHLCGWPADHPGGWWRR